MAKTPKTNEAQAPAASPAPAPAETAASAAPATPAAFKYKVKRIVTLPLLKLREGMTVAVRFEGAAFTGKVITRGPEANKTKEPPIMANVTNLETGELMQIMLGTVLRGILDDDYPEQKYVGLCFVIVVGEKKRGSDGATSYNTYTVTEIEPE